MRLRLAHHYSTPPGAVGLWTWEWATEGLGLIPELHFLRDFHVTQAGIMAASGMGAKIDKRADELMHPGSVPEGMRQERGGLKLRLKGRQAESFRKALALGFVSQRLLNYFSEG